MSRAVSTLLPMTVLQAFVVFLTALLYTATGSYLAALALYLYGTVDCWLLCRGRYEGKRESD